MMLVTHAGTTYYPNGRTGPDSVNNVEQVRVLGDVGMTVVFIAIPPGSTREQIQLTLEEHLNRAFVNGFSLQGRC
jgi:hypothetical protein